MLYIFCDEETGKEVTISAECHPDAIDIAYETMYSPAFVKVMEDAE